MQQLPVTCMLPFPVYDIYFERNRMLKLLTSTTEYVQYTYLQFITSNNVTEVTAALVAAAAHQCLSAAAPLPSA
jgi:hypothetical protein